MIYVPLLFLFLLRKILIFPLKTDIIITKVRYIFTILLMEVPYVCVVSIPYRKTIKKMNLFFFLIYRLKE